MLSDFWMKEVTSKKSTSEQHFTELLRITPNGADGWVPAGLLMDFSNEATVRWRKGTDMIAIIRDKPGKLVLSCIFPWLIFKPAYRPCEASVFFSLKIKIKQKHIFLCKIPEIVIIFDGLKSIVSSTTLRHKVVYIF